MTKANPARSLFLNDGAAPNSCCNRL
jgi:hypothetical protein